MAFPRNRSLLRGVNRIRRFSIPTAAQQGETGDVREKLQGTRGYDQDGLFPADLN
jgi:hypothetical protein